MCPAIAWVPMAIDWPNDLVAHIGEGIVVHEPADGAPGAAVRTILDETMRRAVWRARGREELLLGALKAPYTPLQHVLAIELFRQRIGEAVGLGPATDPAIHALNAYVSANARAICQAYGREMIPYDDSSAVED